MTATKTTAELIRELEATEDALVGTDEGTHNKPHSYRIYETIQGQRYAVRSFAGSVTGTETEAEANERTAGRIRLFPNATSEIRAKQRQLAELRKQARNK